MMNGLINGTKGERNEKKCIMTCFYRVCVCSVCRLVAVCVERPY